MDDVALLSCIEWVAHGFEIVHSIFPRWQFSAPDTVIGFGLHAALLIGPTQKIDERDWAGLLSGLKLDLLRDGAVVDRGRGEYVLGGPVAALRHLVDLLEHDQINPRLAPGEVVTTGTLTRAMPVASGETWSTNVTSGDRSPGSGSNCVEIAKEIST